ncbi:hypothetical protein LCGC14_2870120, partial [marine sediment metagenome]
LSALDNDLSKSEKELCTVEVEV